MTPVWTGRVDSADGDDRKTCRLSVDRPYSLVEYGH